MTAEEHIEKLKYLLEEAINSGHLDQALVYAAERQRRLFPSHRLGIMCGGECCNEVRKVLYLQSVNP